MENEDAIALAALWTSIHNLRILVNRGLASPNEVNEVYGSLVEALQGGDPKFAAMMEQRLEGPFAELRQWAEKLWIGRGKTNPS